MFERVRCVAMMAVALSPSIACGVGDNTATAPNGAEAIGDAGATDATDATGPAYPAFASGLPQVRSLGGPILTSPKIVPVFFSGDPLAADVTKFLKALPGSAYWKEVTGLYGVGTTSTAPAVTVEGEAAPKTIDETQLQAWLAAHLDGTHADWGSPDPSAVYTIYYPATTSFSIQGNVSCKGVGGYHYQATVGTTRVTYAVVARCPNYSLSGIDFVTAGTTHELIEAITDPADNEPAFSAVDPEHMIWGLTPGAEVADMCDLFADAYFKSSELGATVERVWSNARAESGHHPCAPAVEGEVYFNSMPVLEESVTVSAGAKAATRGVKIPVGTSKVIDVRLLSDGATDDWTVAAATVMEPKPTLKFEFDRNTGKNGDTLKLTITALSKGSAGGSPFVITSRLGEKKNIAVGFVAN